MVRKWNHFDFNEAVNHINFKETVNHILFQGTRMQKKACMMYTYSPYKS